MASSCEHSNKSLGGIKDGEFLEELCDHLHRNLVLRFSRLEFNPFHAENLIRNLLTWSRGSSVSIVSDYGLYDRGSIPDRGRGFFF
jgi:hypothetical protein